MISSLSFYDEDETARECLRALSLAMGRRRCMCADDAQDPHPPDLERGAVMVVDAERRVVFFSDMAAAITGRDASLALGRSCREAMPCINCDQECTLFRNGELCGRRVEIETAHGTHALVVKHGWVLRDGTGRIVGGIERFHDVTDLRHQAEQSTERCSLLEAFTEGLDEGLAVVDRTGRIAWISTRAARLLGTTPGAAIGRSLTALLDGPDETLAELAQAVRGRKAELAGLSPVGSSRDLSVHVSPLSHGRTDDLGVAVVLRPAPPVDVEEAFHGIVGRSRAMRQLRSQIGAFARLDSTVLITAESGCGKELIARALHLAGPRATSPFHAFSCAALAEQLLESDLFGHEKGAFTGAHRIKVGRLELSGNGTLFLDEVACLPKNAQARLLRVLEEREYERVGGTRTLLLEARVVVATNADLGKLVEEGVFREDLYYRLKVLRLSVPPLRERRDDIALLAAHFARAFAAAHEATDECPFSAAAVEALEAYSWPGNVRELRNAVQYALAMSRGNQVQPSDLPPEITLAWRGDRDATAEEVTEIERALRQARFSKSEAAALLGVNRTTLWRRMRRLGLA